MANWLYNSLLKQWCEENRVIYKEEKDMTKGARVIIKRICDELMKWCEERHVMCEFATTDDEGLSATFMVGGTTLSVSHIELRDADEFSRYVKSVLFGVDDIIVGNLKAQVDDLKKEIDKKDERIVYLETRFLIENRESLYGQISQLEEEIESKDACIGRLEREDKEKAKDIEYLENKVKGLEKEIKELKNNGRILYLEECIENRDKTVKKLSEDNVSLNYQLEMKRTKISELEQELEEKGKNLNTAADKIVQLKCANTSLKEQIDILKCALNNEREGYGELKDRYNDRCKAYIDMCKWYDSAKAKCDKAEEENVALKKQLNDTIVNKTKTIDEDITIIENLKRENVGLKKQIGDINLTKKKALDKDAELIESLEKEIKRLEYTNNDLDNNVKDMFATVRSLKKESLKKDDEIKALNFQVKTLEGILVSSADSLTKYEDDLSSLRGENTALKEMNDEVKSNNEELKAEIEVLLEKNYDLDNHVKNLVAQVETLDREKGKTLIDRINESMGLTKGVDVLAMHPSIDLSLSDVKKDIEEKQAVIDALKDLDQRISWILTHLNNAETEAAKSFKKLEDDYAQVNHCMTNAFVRINKLEEAQEKKASRKPTKKSQKSDLS